MKQINLKSDNMIRRTESNGSAISLLIGVIVLILGVGSYGGVYFLSKQTKNNITQATADLEQKKVQLNSEKFKELYLFQERISQLKTKVGQRVLSSETIAKLASSTITETAFNSISLITTGTQTKINGAIITSDYDALARQVKSFSLIKGSANVAPGEVSRSDVDNGLKTSIQMDLNKEVIPVATAPTPAIIPVN